MLWWRMRLQSGTGATRDARRVSCRAVRKSTTASRIVDPGGSARQAKVPSQLSGRKGRVLCAMQTPDRRLVRLVASPSRPRSLPTLHFPFLQNDECGQQTYNLPVKSVIGLLMPLHMAEMATNRCDCAHKDGNRADHGRSFPEQGSALRMPGILACMYAGSQPFVDHDDAANSRSVWTNAILRSSPRPQAMQLIPPCANPSQKQF